MIIKFFNLKNINIIKTLYTIIFLLIFLNNLKINNYEQTFYFIIKNLFSAN